MATTLTHHKTIPRYLKVGTYLEVKGVGTFERVPPTPTYLSTYYLEVRLEDITKRYLASSE